MHILLLVFWVGTDLGVFLAAKYSERSEFSMESRQVVLMLGMMLDRLPRSALVLIVPSGLMLTQASGLTELSPSSVLGIWVFAVCCLLVGTALGRLLVGIDQDTEPSRCDKLVAKLNFGFGSFDCCCVFVRASAAT